MSEQQNSPTSEDQVKFSRRDAVKLIGGTAAGVALGTAFSPENSLAEQVNVPNEAEKYMRSNVELEDFARDNGKIITQNSVGRFMEQSSQHMRAYTQGNGMLGSYEMLWFNAEQPEFSLHPDVTNLESTDWSGIDKIISVAKYKEMDSIAFEYLWFDDMGVGQSTSGVKRIPDSLVNGNYSYDDAITLQNKSIDLTFKHLAEQGLFEDDSPKLRIGMFNELLNNNVDANGTLLLNVNDPNTWYKGASYMVSKATESGDQLENKIPRFIVEGLKAAAPYALEHDIQLSIGEYGADTLNDYIWGGENQKAQVFLEFFKALKEHPDTTIQELINKGLLVAALQNHHDASTMINNQGGIDGYAQDVQSTVQQFTELGIPTVGSEFEVTQTGLPGTPDQNDAIQADCTNAVALALYNGGTTEVVAWAANDFNEEKTGILDDKFNRKPNYAALAAAADGKRISFFPGK